MRVILGLLGVALGALIVIKSEAVYRAFGAIPWAEEHLGAEGGSRLFYQLFGLAVILLSFLYLTGMLEGLFVGIFGRLFGIAS